MESPEVISSMREGLWVLMIISAPVMLTALVVGLTVSLMQALTQVQEMTLTFVPKVVAMLLMIMLAMPYMLQSLQDYTLELFNHIANIE
jgi:flagellar biosynthetic protein FliQ